MDEGNKKGRDGEGELVPPHTHDLFTSRPCQYSGRREASCELSKATICHMVRNCGAQTLPLTMHYGVKKWGKMGEGIIGFWPPTKGFLLLGFRSVV